MNVIALKPKLTSARLYNGYVHGFDQHGKQIPEYCGAYTEVREKIEAQGVAIERRS